MSDRGYLFLLITILVLLGLIFITLNIKNTTKPIIFKNETILSIKKDVIRIKNFIGIIITSADIQSNKSNVVYYYIVDQMVKDQYDSLNVISNKEPLFLKDNKETNDRIIKLINHEFTCTPYSVVVASKFFPNLENKVKTVCSISVPPSFGNFDGTINIYLSKEPTEDEKELLKVILSDISDNISTEMENY
jgi:hypothetical protein